MKKVIQAIALSLATLPALVSASPAEDENARLRIEIEQLKTQLKSAQDACAIGAARPASVATSTTAATATVPVVPSAPAAAPEAPAGYKLVKIEPVLPKDDRWKNPRAWDDLSKGLSKQDVEDLLGVEHTVASANDRTFWGYGKVGPSPSGRVIFVDDRLSVWVRPSF